MGDGSATESGGIATIDKPSVDGTKVEPSAVGSVSETGTRPGITKTTPEFTDAEIARLKEIREQTKGTELWDTDDQKRLDRAEGKDEPPKIVTPYEDLANEKLGLPKEPAPVAGKSPPTMADVRTSKSPPKPK